MTLMLEYFGGVMLKSDVCLLFPKKPDCKICVVGRHIVLQLHVVLDLYKTF